jgi:hypothetical protein
MAAFSHFPGSAAGFSQLRKQAKPSEQDQSERDDASQSEDLPELAPRKIEVRRASGC